MAEKRLNYRELFACARKFGVSELPKRGKGSHMIWQRVLEDGRKVTASVPNHGGEEIGVGLIRQVRRRLHLTPKHGVSDEDFYGK